ncbi:hypothetical protein AYO47_06175 [Planctomyces sp. SCGC AG-212-M04]|nr:hypothetical protein AYO47_06175 [Planctomyces sp. SCGC AG-212-M04]
MTRKLSSSRTVRWVGALSVLFCVATVALVLRGDEEDELNPIGILFRRRDTRSQKQDDDAQSKQKPGQLPSDVPKAPPAQYSQARAQPTQTSENADPLMKHVDEALRLTARRLLVAEAPDGKTNSPWQIMHGILALRQNLELRTPRGPVNAVAWVSRDPVFRGDHWFEATRFGGRAHPFSVPYHFEGHVNQTLALFTMCNLPLDHKFAVQGGKGFVTMADMVRHAQMMVNSNEEISWTLWFLTHYLEPDAVWTNYNGERWGMEKLVAIQTGQKVETAPCGGSHGLFALAYARNSYLQKFGKLKGTWLEGDQKIQEHMAKAKAWQNRDGSFSAHYFREPGHTDDPTDRLKSSGHMLEWLMMAVPQQELKENWVRYGVYRVAADLVQFSNQEIDPGPLFHAAHAITLYRERVNPKQNTPQNPKQLDSQLANQPAKTPTPPPVANKVDPPKPTIGPKPTELKPTPETKATPEPKSIATTPNSPSPPRPVDDKRVATRPEETIPPMPKTAPPSPKVPSPEPSVVVEPPRPLPINPAAPVPAPMPEPKTASSDQPLTLPTLPIPGTAPVVNGKRPSPALPIDQPIGVSPAPPSPTPPNTVVGNLPVPPTFELKPTARGTKPDNSAAEPPRPTKVTSATPIVIPPLPLDEVDAAGGK